MKRVLFDIGANKGLYTDANRNKYDICVLVEANPELAQQLQEKYNNDSGIQIVNAIASKNASETFYISNADTISTSDIDWVKAGRFTSTHQWIPVQGIPTVSLDSLISKYGTPELIKIDVEGYEYNVLQSLTQKVPILCFEWAEEKKVEILLSIQYLFSLGFTEFQIQAEDSYIFIPEKNDWLSYETIEFMLQGMLRPADKMKWGMIWARTPEVKKKFLYVDTWNHHKNKRGFELMCATGNIDLTISKSQEEFQKPWDLVFIPGEFIPHHGFPNAKSIMYGPHNFIFVEGPWKRGATDFPSHCFYNLLSDWVIDMQNEFGGLSLATKAIPFAVDTELFKPKKKEKKYDCFVYFKSRDFYDLLYVTNELDRMKLTYQVITYGAYKEEEYIEILENSKFGIWIGGSESQGFAIQESLSMNVPLLVWNCTSMFDVHNHEGKQFRNLEGKYSLKATTIPYWDNRCGLTFTQKEEFPSLLERMLKDYSSFSPREFVLETLSPEACIKRLLKEITY